MLEDKDIEKLIEVFATREEAATKKDIEEMLRRFDELQTAVDGYAKRAETIFQEVIMLTNKMNRFERWAEKVAEKTGVKFES